MGTATSISTLVSQRTSFQGVFEHVWEVKFSVDLGNIATNAVDQTVVAVPGLDPERDIVLGWTHYHTGTHAEELVESIHTWTDELHLVTHNITGGTVNPPAATFRVVMGRLVKNA